MITRVLFATVLVLLGLFTSSATAVITSDELGSHTTTPGVRAFDVDLDGVGLIASDVGEAISARELTALCTATLISNRHVLTSASCFDEDRNGLVDESFASRHVIAFELSTGLKKKSNQLRARRPRVADC